MSLIDRWTDLWEAMNFSRPRTNFIALVSHYEDGKRTYHNMKHIQHCLDELDKVRELLADPHAAELALWMHDVIYDPKRADNEERSAEFALRCLISSGAAPQLVLKVVAHILATKHHRVITNDPDQPFVLDCDMAILGQPNEAFDLYDTQIAQEYGFVPQERYRQGRSSVLQNFERPIFKTPFFRDLYEEAAELNIKRAIQRLS